MLRKFILAFNFLALALFIFFSFGEKNFPDDMIFHAVLKEKNFGEGLAYCFSHYTGRFAFFPFGYFVFKYFPQDARFFIPFNLFMLWVFVLSLSFFLKNYLRVFKKRTVSFKHSLTISSTIASFFFLFFIEGRDDVWFWMSSMILYIGSLIVCLLSFAVLLSGMRKTTKMVLTILLFFITGGCSEVFAAICLVILLMLFFADKKFSIGNSKWIYLLSIAGILSGLLINIFSGGSMRRLGWLQEFNFPYSLKNTVHSLLLPVMQYEYLPLKVMLVLLLIFFSKKYLHLPPIQWNGFLKKAFVVIAFIGISFWIPCYILSDIVPARAASLGYFVFVFFLFDQFIFSKDSIENVVHIF